MYYMFLKNNHLKGSFQREWEQGGSPERNEEDTVDDIELFQHTGHAGGCELRGTKEDEPLCRHREAGVGAPQLHPRQTLRGGMLALEPLR